MLESKGQAMTDLTNEVRWFRGEHVLRDPAQNKDAAFTLSERAKLDLEGLLPSAVLTIDQQVAMELEHIVSKSDPLEQVYRPHRFAGA